MCSSDLKLNTSNKYINDLLASKNIEVTPDLDYGLGHAQQVYTGSFRYDDMSKAQKELLVARIHAMPKFNNRSEERRVGKECKSRWSQYH